MDVNIRVPAIEKLMDHTASGIGSVAGPMLVTWRARREAEALRLSAQGEADSMRIIAEAQADARSLLVAPDSTVSGELSLTQTINQRIQYQEEKRQRNIAAVVSLAADELGHKEVPNSETNHDWTARFFSDAQDVSSEEMQTLWAKVLAGEVERPGNTSIRTLNILRNLDQNTARLFRKFCSACVSLHYPSGQVGDARVCNLGGNAGQNALQKYGFNFNALNTLSEYGLIISSYSTNLPYGKHPFRYQGEHWVFASKAEEGTDTVEAFRLSGVPLTQSGRELLNVVDLEPMEEYTQDLMKFIESRNLKMIKLGAK